MRDTQAPKAPDARVDVLAVDDDPRNLLALEAVLGDLPINLVRARSGVEALGILAEREFSLILMDVHMPSMDGFETAKRIQTLGRATPIIFLTANDDPRRAATGYAHGAVDYMFKPLVPEVLRAKVSVFVELQRSREQLVAQRLAEQTLRHEADLLRARLEQQQAFATALSSSLQNTQEALAVRDEFLRMASHQLRTPLASMQITIDNAIRALDAPPSKDRSARVLHILDEQTGNLTRLVRELLNFVVIESGRLQFKVETVDLVVVARQCVGQLDALMSAAGCPTTIQGDATCMARCDGFWLQQALLNLLGNACKYGSGHPVGVTVIRQGDRARLEVRDSGMGIEPSEQARIFEAFQRAVSSDNYGGLGLGLYVVKRVIEGQGGTVSVHSAPGQGATFTLLMPV